MNEITSSIENNPKIRGITTVKPSRPIAWHGEKGEYILDPEGVASWIQWAEYTIRKLQDES